LLFLYLVFLAGERATVSQAAAAIWLTADALGG
jgi:hypothetical protein